MRTKIILLSIICLTLVSPSVHAQTPRRVVCLGDSLTVGYGPKFRTPDGLSCTVNARVGRPTQEMVTEWRSNIKGKGFTDLIIMGGTNNMGSDRSAQTAIDNLRTIYSEAKADGLRVVVITIPPFAGHVSYRDDPAETQARIDRLNNFVRGAGMDILVDANGALSDSARPTFLNPTYAGGDGLHLKPVGYQFLADTISNQAFGGTTPGGAAPPSREIIIPKLKIDIPTVQLGQGAEEGGVLKLPFLSSYIAGLYTYLLGIVGIVAGIMIVIGGVQYLLSAGNSSAIEAAKERIKNSLIGLVIAFGSYTMLYIINPQLVRFDALRIRAVGPVILDVSEEPGGVDYGGDSSFVTGGGGGGVSRAAADTTHDNVFQRYAGCAGIDWRILKAIAFKESRFNESIVNGYGFIGLFQTKAPTCASHLRPYGRAGECRNLTSPETNTASAIIGLSRAVNTIRNRCPNANTEKFVTLLYIAHNSGQGSLTGTPRSQGVLDRVGCDGDYRAGLAAFWAQQSTRVQNGASRASYAQAVARLAMNYGVQTPLTTGNCALVRQ